MAAPDEDVRGGERLLSRGEVIGPAAVGTLVASRVSDVACVRLPRVLLLSTGDELIEPGELKGHTGRIVNGNAAALGAELTRLGLPWTYGGIVPDDPKALRAAFERALAEPVDLLLTTGGVSVGPRDLVARVWLELGARRVAGRVEIKPGGLFFAGQLRERWVVGLSGCRCTAGGNNLAPKTVT